MQRVGINKHKLYVKIKWKNTSLTSGIFLYLCLVAEYFLKHVLCYFSKIWGKKTQQVFVIIYMTTIRLSHDNHCNTTAINSQMFQRGLLMFYRKT